MEQLLDVLSYQREILTQLLVVASIFGGGYVVLSATVVVTVVVCVTLGYLAVFLA